MGPVAAGTHVVLAIDWLQTTRRDSGERRSDRCPRAIGVDEMFRMLTVRGAIARALAAKSGISADRTTSAPMYIRPSDEGRMVDRRLLVAVERADRVGAGVCTMWGPVPGIDDAFAQPGRMCGDLGSAASEADVWVKRGIGCLRARTTGRRRTRRGPRVPRVRRIRAPDRAARRCGR